jgi:hypothetical protein
MSYYDVTIVFGALALDVSRLFRRIPFPHHEIQVWFLQQRNHRLDHMRWDCNSIESRGADNTVQSGNPGFSSTAGSTLSPSNGEFTKSTATVDHHLATVARDLSFFLRWNDLNLLLN